MATQFHLALPCVNINKTRAFYSEVLGAQIGRSSVKWADVNLYNNQITFTECGPFKFECKSYSFNGDILPSFHFGIILPDTEWSTLYQKMKQEDFLYIDETAFLSEKPGAHKSFFLRDPNGYIIEFKCFETPEEVFQE